MSLKKFGVAAIKLNGTHYKTYPGATFDPGGIVRTERVGHTVHGYSESQKAGTIEFETDLGVGESIDDFEAFADGTVLVEADTGQTYVGRNWWCAERPNFTDGSDGRLKVKLMGSRLEEML